MGQFHFMAEPTVAACVVCGGDGRHLLMMIRMLEVCELLKYSLERQHKPKLLFFSK
jgi:hypothetical protein